MKKLTLKKRILNFLSESREMKFTTREIADALNHNRKSICVLARELHKDELIKSDRTGLKTSIAGLYWLEVAMTRRQVYHSERYLFETKLPFDEHEKLANELLSPEQEKSTREMLKSLRNILKIITENNRKQRHITRGVA